MSDGWVVTYERFPKVFADSRQDARDYVREQVTPQGSKIKWDPPMTNGGEMARTFLEHYDAWVFSGWEIYPVDRIPPQKEG